MLTFAHPGVLWLLPLALLPAVIHLLSRMAPPTLRFPGTRFLKPSPMPLQGFRFWRQILLLALRTAIVALIVLLGALPRWQPKALDNGGTESPRIGVAALLDTSASMMDAIGELRAEAKALPDGTRFISTGDGGGGLSPDAWNAGFSGWNPKRGLEDAARWLSGFQPGFRELHVFSDFQEASWREVDSGMPEGTRIVTHAPKRRPRSNCAVVYAAATGITAQGETTVEVRCRNWGAESALRTVVLETDVARVTQELLLPPGEATAALFLVPASVNPAATVRLEPADEMPFDDSRCFWARRSPPSPLLAVFDGTEEKVADELEFFAIPALTAEPEGSYPRYEVSMLDATGLPFADFTSERAVFLFGVSDGLQDESYERLRAYAEAGGAVFWIPGARPESEWRRLQSVGIAPPGHAFLERRPTGLGPVPAGSPVASLFPESNPSDLHAFTIRQWLQVAPSANDSVLLETLDHAPALIRHPIGQGEAFFFTFGFHAAASGITLSKSFLPLMRELLETALAEKSEILRIDCGTIPPQVDNLVGEATRAEFTTSTPGCHRLGRMLVEVNPPASESNPVFLDPASMERALAAKNTTRGKTTGNDGQDEKVPWILPAFLLAALAAEALTANRQSRRMA